MLIESVILILLIALFCISTAKIDKIKHRAVWITVSSVFYIAVLMMFTLLSRADVADTSVSLVPFESFFEILKVRWYGWGEYLFLAIVGNMLLFVPLGIIIGNAFNCRYSLMFSFIAGFLISFSIECIQYFIALGAFEMDDIIVNTWGAIIGCAVVNAIRKKDESAKKILTELTPLLVFTSVLFVFCIVPLLKEFIRLFGF